jgi:hypothetical protein
VSKCAYPLFLKLGFVLIFFQANSAIASRGDRTPGSRYVTARGAAMGDSIFGQIDPESVAESLFYNPAGFSLIENKVIQPLHFQWQGNTPTFSNAGLDFYNVGNLERFKDTLISNPNSYMGGSASIFPNFGARGFGFGVLAQGRVGAISDGVGNINYLSKYEFIPTFGIGWKIASGVIRLGYTLQYVSTATGDLTIPDTQSPLGYNQNLKQGAGLSHNFGFLLTLPWKYTPWFTFVARNIGGLNYNQAALYSFTSNSTGAPDNEPFSLDVALGWVNRLGNDYLVSWNFALRDATDSQNTARLARLAFGTEITFPDRIFVRFGVASFYPSLGIGVKTKRSELGISWYSEEMGSGLRSEKDTRILFNYALKLFN